MTAHPTTRPRPTVEEVAKRLGMDRTGAHWGAAVSNPDGSIREFTPWLSERTLAAVIRATVLCMEAGREAEIVIYPETKCHKQNCRECREDFARASQEAVEDRMALMQSPPCVCGHRRDQHYNDDKCVIRRKGDETESCECEGYLARAAAPETSGREREREQNYARNAFLKGAHWFAKRMRNQVDDLLHTESIAASEISYPRAVPTEEHGR